MRDEWKKEFIEKFLKLGLPSLCLFMIPVVSGVKIAIPFFIPIVAIGMTPCALVILVKLFPDVFFTRQWRYKAAPTFSIIRTLKTERKFDEALDELIKMTEVFPQELDVWFEALETALMDLKDKKRAESVYRDALSVLESCKKRDAIDRFYRNIVG